MLRILQYFISFWAGVFSQRAPIWTMKQPFVVGVCFVVHFIPISILEPATQPPNAQRRRKWETTEKGLTISWNWLDVNNNNNNHKYFAPNKILSYFYVSEHHKWWECFRWDVRLVPSVLSFQQNAQTMMFQRAFGFYVTLCATQSELNYSAYETLIYFNRFWISKDRCCCKLNLWITSRGSGRGGNSNKSCSQSGGKKEGWAGTGSLRSERCDQSGEELEDWSAVLWQNMDRWHRPI